MSLYISNSYASFVSSCVQKYAKFGAKLNKRRTSFSIRRLRMRRDRARGLSPWRRLVYAVTRSRLKNSAIWNWSGSYSDIIRQVNISTAQLSQLWCRLFPGNVSPCRLFLSFVFLLLGIILEYDTGGSVGSKSIDLLDLSPGCVSCVMSAVSFSLCTNCNVTMTLCGRVTAFPPLKQVKCVLLIMQHCY